MSVIVLKFGGTSVADINKIYNVANIVEKQLNNNKLIVVLSAMAGKLIRCKSILMKLNQKKKLENDLLLHQEKNVTIGILSSILKKEK